MGLIGAGAFLNALAGYRTCWISGRTGGFKTSLSYKLASIWLEKGYRLVTNNRSIWADDLGQLEFVNDSGHLKCVVIVDEAGMDVETSRQVKAMFAYKAKMDMIILMPSVEDVPRAAQKLICQQLFNFQLIGIPLVVYRYQISQGAFKDAGTFFWWRPSEVFGIYSRQDPGAGAADIIRWIESKTREFRSLHGRSSEQVSGVEAQEADLFKDAANTIAEAVEYVSVPTRRHRRRRS